MKKYLLCIIISGIIFTSIGASAVIMMKAEEVSFTPSDSSWNVNDVQNAIEDIKSNYLDNESLINTGDLIAFKVGAGDMYSSVINLGKNATTGSGEGDSPLTFIEPYELNKSYTALIIACVKSDNPIIVNTVGGTVDSYEVLATRQGFAGKDHVIRITFTPTSQDFYLKMNANMHNYTTTALIYKN